MHVSVPFVYSENIPYYSMYGLREILVFTLYTIYANKKLIRIERERLGKV